MNTQPYRESLPSINEAIPDFLNWSRPQKASRQPALQPQLSQTQQPPSSQTTHCQPSISTCPRSTLQTTHGRHISYTNPRYKVAEEDDEYGQQHRHILTCNPLRYQAQTSSELAYPLEVSRKGENQELDILSHTDWAEILASSAALQRWSTHYASMAQDRGQPVNVDMVPLLSVENMLQHSEKIGSALNITRGQLLREQRCKDTGDGMERKKRSGRAPPSGCSQCNRAESPEWRKGPDGPRTLCNACGLHYAKLIRKNAAKDSKSRLS